MKKILVFIFASLMLVSCGRPYYKSNVSLDYSKYSKDGFFITEANSAPFDYDGVASLHICIYSGVDKQWAKKQVKFDDNLDKKWRSAKYVDGVEEIYNQAISKGANGIINLQYSVTYAKGGSIDYVEVRGMAIRRK